MTLAIGHRRVGEIEVDQHLGDVGPIHKPVNRPPRRIRLFGKLDGPAVHGPVQHAANGQERIAQRLEFQAPNVRAPEQPIGRINLGVARIVRAALLIDA